MSWQNKDADDIADYAIDWSAEVTDDRTIIDDEWIVPDGLTGAARPRAGNVAIVRLSGGQPGRRYRVTSRVTFSTGERLDASQVLHVVER